MKRKIISFFLCVILLIMCTSCSNREITLIKDKQNDEFSYYEDIPAAYSYSVELSVDKKLISNGEKISMQENLQHKLKIKDYIGAKYSIGLIVTANGIPISFDVDGSSETMYVFEPTKKTIEFSFDATNYPGAKIDIVLLSELGRTPEFYLDSIHNYSNSIYYILSGDANQNEVGTPDECIVSQLPKEKIEQTNGVVATITKEVGYGTDKYLNYSSAKHGLYINLYGATGNYSVITLCGSKLYNGFGNTSHMQIHIDESRLKSLPISCSEIDKNSIEPIYCIVVPCDTKVEGIFDSPMVQIIGDNKMSIEEASRLSVHIEVSERKLDLTEKHITLDITPTGFPTDHRFRLLCIADGLLQNFEVQGKEYTSYSVRLNETVSLSMEPNVSCKVDDSFVLSFFLVLESTSEVYSEEYMLDPATKRMRAEVVVQNKYGNLESDRSMSKNEQNTSNNSGISRWTFSTDSSKDDRFCSFIKVYDDNCNMTYTYVPQTTDKKYLTIFLLNGEVVSFDKEHTCLIWNSYDNKGLQYSVDYKFEKGLNRICAITIALDNNDIEVTRTKVLVSTDMFKSEYAAISTAIGIGEGKVYLAPIDEFSIKYRMSEYGFMTVNSGESGTKRINRIGSIVPGDTELIDIVDTECNTFAVSLVVQKDNLYTFVKYYTYGRTN